MHNVQVVLEEHYLQYARKVKFIFSKIYAYNLNTIYIHYLFQQIQH